MAHDGSYEVTWKGHAFPYLMHHPNSFLATENYGSARTTGHGHTNSAPGHGSDRSDATTRAGTGTWNGPAPRGYLNGAPPPANPNDGPANASTSSGPVLVPAQEPSSVRLSNGLLLPMIGLGTVSIKDPAVVRTALTLGYRHLDCAWFYKNESVIGEGLKDFIGEGRRSELFITSKVWNTHHRPAAVRESAEQSLAALGCEYLDLLLMHWPDAWLPEMDLNATVPLVDTEVTLQQTWQAMEALVDEGKVRAIGVSNFSLPQIEELLSFVRIPPVVNQIELHPLLAQRKLIGVCYRKGVQCVAYSPLGSSGGFVKNDLLSNSVVLEVAKETGKSPAQVLLKWNMQRGIVVIPRSSSEAHLRDNIEGMNTWKLTNVQKARLDDLDQGKRFITFEWKQWADPEEGGIAKPSLVLKQ